MGKIEQEVVFRNCICNSCNTIREWEDGAHERFEQFIHTVTNKANEIAEDKDVVILNISYPNDLVAVITYLKRGEKL